MRRLQRIALGGLIVPTLAGCTRWMVAEQPAHALEAPPGLSAEHVQPLEAGSPAPQPADAAKEPEGIPAGARATPAAPPRAAAEPALEPPVEPDRSPPEPPPSLLHGELLVGASVEREDGVVETVEDLLFDAATGKVVGVVIARPGGAWVLDAAAARWTRGPTGWRLIVDSAGAAAPLDLDTAALFDAQEPELIAGEVRAIEIVGSGPERAAILTLHDDANLLHRALIGAPHLVAQQMPSVTVGSRVEVEGVLTRDAKGKLWIASRLAIGAEDLALRDDSGSLLWADMARHLPCASSLTGTSIRGEAGAELAVVGWMLDRERRRALLRVVLDGSERTVPWTRLEPGDRR